MIPDALMFLIGIAYRKRLEANMIVNRYWFPERVLGNGPTQSIITMLKGSPNRV